MRIAVELSSHLSEYRSRHGPLRAPSFFGPVQRYAK